MIIFFYMSMFISGLLVTVIALPTNHCSIFGYPLETDPDEYNIPTLQTVFET